MKVAIVHNLKRGGAARRLQGTVASLALRDDVELCEFTMSMGEHTLGIEAMEGAAGVSRVVVPHEPLAPGMSSLRRPLSRYADERRIEARWARVATKIDEWAPDVVFGNPCGLLLAAPPALERVTSPVVYYCDEPRRQDYERASRRTTNVATRPLYAPLRRRQRRNDRAAIAASALIATNSAHSQRGIRTAYGREATVVPPGIADCFNGDNFIDETTQDYCVSVGSLIPTKGHDLAISALGALAARGSTSLRLVIVAPREDRTERERLQRLADEHVVGLEFAFGISDEDLVSIYSRAFCTVYLAREEPLGLASLESQACGTPAIVSDEGGLPSTVDEGRTGFAISRTDAGAIANVLERMAADSDRYGALRSRSLEKPVFRNADAAAAMWALFETSIGAGDRS